MKSQIIHYNAHYKPIKQILWYDSSKQTIPQKNIDEYAMFSWNIFKLVLNDHNLIYWSLYKYAHNLFKNSLFSARATNVLTQSI